MARKSGAVDSVTSTPSRKQPRRCISAATTILGETSVPAANGRGERKRAVASTGTNYAEGASSASDSDDNELETRASKKTARKTKTKSKRGGKLGDDEEEEEAIIAAKSESDASNAATPPSSKKKKTKTTNAPKRAAVDNDNDNNNNNEPPKPKRPRKTKEQKAAEAMPIAPRTAAPKILVGAHVSAAGGVHNAVTNAHHIGSNAFALFLKSQRKWDNPPIAPAAAAQFTHLCDTHAYNPSAHIVPHGSYLVNLAAKDAARSAQAYAGFLDDLRRADALGIALYNLHPGNTNGEPRAEAVARIAAHLDAAHAATAPSRITVLLENMAGSPAGNTIGSSFEDLAAIIARVADKSRVGVCLDTCHAFAAGYDLRSAAAFADTLAAFDRVVGLRYLRAVHVNDSKAPLAAHRDLHQNIGTGFLGLRAFHNLVNEPAFAGLPLVLETPIERTGEDGKAVEDKAVWAREIKLLESLVGMDAEGSEFAALERELAEKGADERRKFQAQFDKKMDKEARKKPGRGKKRKKPQSDEDDSQSAAAESSS